MTRAMTDAGLITADAGTYVVASTGQSLSDKGGVTNHCAYCAHHIRLPGREDLLRHLWLVDTPSDKYRNPNALFDNRRMFREISVRDGHRWKHMNPSAHRRAGAANYTDVVDQLAFVERDAEV